MVMMIIDGDDNDDNNDDIYIYLYMNELLCIINNQSLSITIIWWLLLPLELVEPLLLYRAVKIAWNFLIKVLGALLTTFINNIPINHLINLYKHQIKSFN